MKKFSKIFEEYIAKKFYKATCSVELIIEADSEGDAGQMVDSDLGGLEYLSDFKIQDISEISKEEFKKKSLTESTTVNVNDTIVSNWENKFGEKTPSLIQKMEFYHLLRMSGFTKDTIFESLKNKL
jgi:hypothetical protein